MKTTARSLLSAIGLSLAAFTALSFFVAGLAASPTVVGFALLVVYGVVEMAIVGYAPAPAWPGASRFRSVSQAGGKPVRIARLSRPAVALRRAA